VWEVGLGFLTFGTSLDVLFHKFSESGSFVQLLHELPCVRDPWMAPCWAIVDLSQHSLSFLDVIIEKKFSDCWFGVRKEGVVKEDMQFIGIHLLVKVFSSREEIGDSVCIARNMGQLVVEILEVFNPLCLTAGNLLGLMEVLEVLVVGANLNRVCGTKEQRATAFKPEDYGSKFFIVGIIVLFSGEKAS
jgi:hypothetical protein